MPWPGSVRLARAAMATRFELVLHGDDPVRLRASGEEALAEIDRLEEALSFYRPAGALGRLNRAPRGTSVRVPTALFGALALARSAWESTDGAFDPTVGPLMRCWGLAGGTPRVPGPDELEAARGRCGFEAVTLDERSRAIRLGRDGMEIDLGGIGKGFAIDEAVRLLDESGVPGALLHGGTSTIAAIGLDPSGRPWRVGIPGPGAPGTGPPLVIELRNASLSVSEPRGKGFVADGTFYGHVLDPRSGRPTRGVVLAAVRTRSAALSDALSTALLVLGPNAPSTAAFTDGGVDFLAVAGGPDAPATIVARGLRAFAPNP